MNLCIMDPNLFVGCTVNLLKEGKIVTDSEGHPYLYQVTSIHKKVSEISLVNSLGEYAGRYHSDSVVYYNSDPLFSSEGYEIGQKVSWVENDSVYEGVIVKLSSKTVEVNDIKLLMPLDYVKRLPYYKIYGDPTE